MKQASREHPQRGVLIIWLALFLLVMIGFVSVGVDLAKLVVTQGQLQAAADAAALAGATAVDSGGVIIPDLAKARAEDAALQNNAYELVPTPVVVDPADIDFPTDSSIRVIARREGDTAMITHFAAAFLGPDFHKLDMAATATAESRRAGAVYCGLVPVGGIAPSGENFKVGCPNEYKLRLSPGSGISGDYYFVDFPACDKGGCAGDPQTGANTFRCLLENGYCCTVAVGDTLQPEPGSMSGPFVQGINARIAADTDQRLGICYEVYTGNNSRVIPIPLTTPPTGGRGPVVVTGFARFFIKDKATGGVNAQLIGEFIDGVQPGSGGGGAGSLTFSIHLVK